MSLPLCHHTVAAAIAASSAAAKPQTEEEIFAARGQELTRIARHDRRVRAFAGIKALWSRLVGRFAHKATTTELQAELLQRLDAMPPYLLDDIGVSRAVPGRYVFEDDFGRSVPLVPEPTEAPAARPHAPNAAQGAVAAE